ncbi:MAG: hypothetical protein Q4P18_07110 [Methanobrevibacter sp.]|uniref:hypothetical protein n=1 Tax=Methanobrevibacter sp. TaxID=66852 RepID=UPI0026DFA04B|nr:hypothetical protein [Methanobrevibacter sp.]MDO5849286.1 hypothetical protein [Methanobrevibacter sp.]
MIEYGLINDKDFLIEELAELEHEQWIEWSKSIAKDMDKLLDIANIASVYNYTTDEQGKLIIKQDERLERWKTLWIPYNDLDEKIKESDRVYARKVFELIENYLKSFPQDEDMISIDDVKALIEKVYFEFADTGSKSEEDMHVKFGRREALEKLSKEIGFEIERGFPKYYKPQMEKDGE